MPRESYQSALSDLRSDVVEMGALVSGRLADALAALEGNEAAARRVIDGDDAVDERYLEIETACIDLFALQQPVAGDLRFIAASFKIITDLERVGDLATNLGSYALAERRTEVPDLGVGHIGAEARALLDDAIAAYETDDADACREIAARDDDLDVLCRQASEHTVRDLVERGAGADPWAAEQVLDDVSRLLLTVRDLERVGDHAVNIAARTLYMTETDASLI